MSDEVNGGAVSDGGSVDSQGSTEDITIESLQTALAEAKAQRDADNEKWKRSLNDKQQEILKKKAKAKEFEQQLNETRKQLEERQARESHSSEEENAKIQSIMQKHADELSQRDTLIDGYKKAEYERKVTGAISKAAFKEGALNPSEVSILLQHEGLVRLDESGNVVVYDKNGTPRYNGADYLKVEEYVKEFLDDPIRAHLKKNIINPGSGGTPASTNQTPSAPRDTVFQNRVKNVVSSVPNAKKIFS
jgi:hypothetical protein